MSSPLDQCPIYLVSDGAVKTYYAELVRQGVPLPLLTNLTLGYIYQTSVFVHISL